MPDFSYYATFDESIALLDKLVKECHVRLILDLGRFAEPIAPLYNEVSSEVIEQLRRRRALFLAGSFTKYPLKFGQRVEGPAAGSYYIIIPEGGPLMHMTLATVNIIDGQLTLVSGMVSYQKLYINPNTGLSEPASIQVKEAYKAIVKTTKKWLVPYQLAMKIWIGPVALRMLKAKQARIIDQGVLYGLNR
jgi:hypothetical protein